jgi:hypothetical protein
MPILGSNSSSGSRPSTPTIGSATDGGTGTTASVAFTPSTYIGKGTITYTATSSPGGLTATGSSPITVTGLTTGTAYTFTVQGSTNYGVNSAVSSTSNSVTPATPSSFESIATFTGSSGASNTVTFSSIPSGYKSLQIRWQYLDSVNSAALVNLRFNGDTGTNYARHRLMGYNSSVFTSATAGTTAIYISSNNSTISTNTTFPGVGIVDIIDYSSTTKNKTVRGIYGLDGNNAANYDEITLLSGLWMSTSAINSITIFTGGTKFNTGSSIALYGVK